MISANFTASQTCIHISNVHHACNKKARASLGRILTKSIVSVSKIIKTCLPLCDQSPPHPQLCKMNFANDLFAPTPKENGPLNIGTENAADQ